MFSPAVVFLFFVVFFLIKSAEKVAPAHAQFTAMHLISVNKQSNKQRDGYIAPWRLVITFTGKRESGKLMHTLKQKSHIRIFSRESESWHRHSKAESLKPTCQPKTAVTVYLESAKKPLKNTICCFMCGTLTMVVTINRLIFKYFYAKLS